MEFTSALPYAKVRDFAYHDKHPLHYGVRPEPQQPDHEELGDQDFYDDERHEYDEQDDIQGNGHQYDETHDGDDTKYIRQTPDDIYSRAVALFDFEPENCNEIRLVGGQVVWISYRHGQGWLVAENLETGDTGLVPEEYVQVLPENESEWEDTS